MACEKRERTGSCGHHQCPFPHHSGYNCIDIAFNAQGRGFCEAGENCNKECPYDYRTPEDIKAADEAFRAMYPDYFTDELVS